MGTDVQVARAGQKTNTCALYSSGKKEKNGPYLHLRQVLNKSIYFYAYYDRKDMHE